MPNLSSPIDKKFISSIDVNDWEIETDTGWEKVSHIHKTIPYQKWNITTENGLQLSCADTHILFTENFNEIFVKDIIPGKTQIVTQDGLKTVTDIQTLQTKENMFDLSIQSPNHRFYTNRILSHNSTILDALCFVLFGKSYRGINVPQLVNSINQKDLYVEITFKIRKKVYKVVRGLKPRIFEIFCDGVLIDQSSRQFDYQNMLETTILKMNYKTFTQVVILGSSSFVPFMRLVPKDRREIIEDLLDIQIFSQMNIVLKGKMSLLNKKLSKNKAECLMADERIQLQMDYIAETESHLEERLKGSQTTIAEVESEIATIEVDIQKTETEIAKMVDSIATLGDTQRQLVILELYKDQIEKRCRKAKKDVKFFEENDDCPTCSQEITPELQKTKQKEKEDLIARLTLGIQKLEPKLVAISTSITAMQQTEAAINVHRSVIVDKDSSKKAKREYIGKLQAEIDAVDTKKENRSHGEEKLLGFHKDLVQLEETADQFEDEKKYQEISADYLKDTGIKSMVIQKYLPIMNKLISKYLTALDFFVSFELDDNFIERIKSRYRDEFTYGSFSEGERFRIDIALLLAWREVARLKNSVHTNLLLLDEVFDSSLDSSGTEDFLALIHSLGKTTNCFIITHKADQLLDKFDRAIRFSKQKNFSTMEFL